MRNPRRLKNGRKEIEKREKRREHKEGRAEERLIKNGEKKEDNADQERSNKENLSIERQQHKKTTHRI